MGYAFCSNDVKSGFPILDHFIVQLESYISNNSCGPSFMVYRCWTATSHIPTENNPWVWDRMSIGQFTGPLREIMRSLNVSYNKMMVFCTICKRFSGVRPLMKIWQNILSENQLSAVKLVATRISGSNLKTTPLKNTLYLHYSYD